MITNIEFNGAVNPSEIKIQADGPFSAEPGALGSDNSLAIDLKGAAISAANSRPIDTSSFDSKVTQITSFAVPGKSDTVRVVLQLREPGTVDLAPSGSGLVIRVPRATAAINPVAPAQAVQPVAERLTEFMGNRDLQKFTGKPISLSVRDADVTDVFKLIGEASGFNVVIGGDVTGKITLSLTEVPWDQALDLILHTMQLGAERNNNILRISSLKSFTEEKKQELAAQSMSALSTPKITKIFPISYATLKDLAAALTKFSSSSAGGSSGGAANDDPSIVQVDDRTNSIIVHDIPKNVERMGKLISILDTQTPQVLIEAKIIEADENFANKIGGSLGFGDTSSSNSGFVSLANANPTDALIGPTGVFPNGAAIVPGSLPAGTSQAGFSPTLSFISSTFRLNALLSLGESESQSKTLGAPKMVVLSKQKASILETTPVLVPGTTIVPGVGQVATASIQQANLGLTVTPTVTNDASVLMDLDVSKDIATASAGQSSTNAVAKRNLKTQVLVESGTTLVIGGIYTEDTLKGSTGFPILRDIPILGFLFGSKSSTSQHTELFIFITPRILNSKATFVGGG